MTSSIRVGNGSILAGDTILPAAHIVIDGASIASVTPLDACDEGGGWDIDLEDGWLLPGFVDVQVNGGGGVLFNNDPSVEGLATISAAHARFGTTGFMPTLISDTIEGIATALDAVDAAIEAGVPGVLGIHIEGPFINPVRKGIHSETLIRPFDPALLDLLARPRRGLVMMTMAPERVADDDIKQLIAAGILLCEGHSNATYEEAMHGFELGMTGVTHLFNAMSPLAHRAPGLVGAALDHDAAYCGLIADGIHILPPALRLAVKVKGPEHIMLVTDAMPGVGFDSGSFRLNDQEITIRNGKCFGKDGTLAGSNLDMASAVRNIMEYCGVDMKTASRMASATPSAFLGLDKQRGTLAPGYRADFITLDAEKSPSGTWIGGIRQAG